MNIFEDDRIKFFMLCIIIVLQVITVSTVVLCNDCFNDGDKQENNSEIAIVEKKEENISDNVEVLSNIRVDVKGAVKKAGVYELDRNSRVIDAINLAGGFKSNASTKYLNLSKKISDEMVIYVYTTNQVKSMGIKEEIKEECNCPTVDTSICAGSNIIVSDKNNNTNVEENKNETEGSNKVSLNNASKEELMTLSGIGESKALAIIEYRSKNNGFKVLEDIMNVSGIGESLYNKIKDNITL